MGKLRTADIIGDPSTRSILVEIDRVGNLALEDHGAILIGWTFVNLPLNHMNGVERCFGPRTGWNVVDEGGLHCAACRGPDDQT